VNPKNDDVTNSTSVFTTSIADSAVTSITTIPELVSNETQLNGPDSIFSSSEVSRITETLNRGVGNVEIQNKVFESIAGPKWHQAFAEGKFGLAQSIWTDIMPIVYDWELKHPGQQVHKGTSYYFWAGTCILAGNLEMGFLLMHQALEEDKWLTSMSKPKTPAQFFVTLNPDPQDQYFRSMVAEVSYFIEDRLTTYRTDRVTSLTGDQFRKMFLLNHELREEAFSFTFEAFRLKALNEMNTRLLENTFGSLTAAKTFLSMCLVVDNVIHNKNTGQWRFAEHVTFLSTQTSLSLNDHKVKELNGSFKGDFPGTVKKMLDSQYRFQDGTTLSRMEEDFSLAYGFRNFAAHKLEDQPIIYQNFKELTQRILNTLFFTIEKLY